MLPRIQHQQIGLEALHTSRRDYVERRKLIGGKLDFILTPEVFAGLSALARSLPDVLGQPRTGHALPTRPHFASGGRN